MVAAGKFLESRWLAMIGGFLPKPLPSNDKGIYTQTDGRNFLIGP
jgi:hypothetical protein